MSAADTEQEEDAIGNYPENLQNTDTFAEMEEAAENLSDASDALGEAVEYIEAAIK